MSESENTVRYLADAARRRGSRDQSVGPAEPEPTRSGGRRARAGFDGAQGFANRMLDEQDEHDGGRPRPEASPTLDEQIDGALRGSQTRRRVTKLPMIPSAHSARITPEANGTLAASPPGAFRRNRPRVKVARKRNISGRGWGRMMVAVTVAAAGLAGLIIAKPGRSGSSGQPISSHSAVAAISYERHGSLALTSSFLKQEARAEASAAARRELAIKRRLGHFEVGIAIASARDLVQLPQRDQASHYVTPAATSQADASTASASATSSTAQVTTATSPTYTPPAPSTGGGSSTSGGGSSSSGNTSSGGSSSTKSGSTPAFGSGGALGPGYSPDS